MCLQHVTVEDSYLCGYLKIKGLTEVSFKTRPDLVRLTFILSTNWFLELNEWELVCACMVKKTNA